MIYVTSDIHGYSLDSFKMLLQKAGFSDEDFLFVLGDVIDRNGDGGVAMLRWMMQQPNIELILGNHEDMMLACRYLYDEVTDDSLANFNMDKLYAMQDWMFNGGKPTMDSLRSLHREDPEALQDIFDYLSDAPFYETVTVGVRDFLLTHSGIGNFEKDKPMDAYSVKDILWNRPKVDDIYYDDVFTVFGHTPVELLGPVPDRAFRTKTWIDIDTGAAGGGAPMLLRLDDMREFYAD